MARRGITWLLTLGAACIQPFAAAQCEYEWISITGTFPPPDAHITAMVRWDPDGAGPLGEWLFAAGGRSSGGLLASGWNGSAWHALPGVPQTSAASMMLYGNLLTVGGGDGAGNGRVLQWDSAAWQQLGSDLPGTVGALTEFESDLIAGGDFEGVARWDGNTWSWVGDTALIAVDLQPFQNELIATGYSNDGFARIIRWDGQAWSTLVEWGPFDVEFGAMVYAMTEHDGRLIAGGTFATIGGVPAEQIAAWDGQAWAALGAGRPNPILEIASVDDGLFAVAGQDISRWDGTNWEDIGSIDGWIGQIAWYDSEIWIGGFFSSVADVAATSIARWNGEHWRCPDAPVIDQVRAMAVFRDELYFSPIVDIPLSQPWRWDGRQIRTVGAGHAQRLFAMLATDDSLFASGYFDFDDKAETLARWDGTAWHPTNSAVLGGVAAALSIHRGELAARCDAGIFAWDGIAWRLLAPQPAGSGDLLASYRDELYVDAAREVARWDGSSWQSFQIYPHADRPPPEHWTIQALQVYRDKLVIAAQSSGRDGLDVWDGQQWGLIPTGPGVGTEVEYVGAMAVFQDDLIIAGILGSGLGVQGVARWDGAAWHTLGAASRFTGTGQMKLASAPRLLASTAHLFAEQSPHRPPNVLRCPPGCDCDWDADGVPNSADRCPSADDSLDRDEDGVPNCVDNCLSVANPQQDDADGDGVGDACEPQGGGSGAAGGPADDGASDAQGESGEQPDLVDAPASPVRCGSCGAGGGLALIGLLALLPRRGRFSRAGAPRGADGVPGMR